MKRRPASRRVCITMEISIQHTHTVSCLPTDATTCYYSPQHHVTDPRNVTSVTSKGRVICPLPCASAAATGRDEAQHVVFLRI